MTKYRVEGWIQMTVSLDTYVEVDSPEQAKSLVYNIYAVPFDINNNELNVEEVKDG